MGLDISLAPEVLFYIGRLPITNTFFWSVCLSAILIIATILFKANLKMNPGKGQNFVEMLVAEAYKFTESIIGEGKKAKRVFPLVGTMFFFILISNLVTFIPGQAAVTLRTSEGIVPLFRGIIADYGLVFVMTIISVIVAQVVAIAVNGPKVHLKRFINFQNPLKFFLGIMELIGELAKIASLSFRLFGNIFADEVLTAVTLFLIPFIVPLPFMFLGLLTAVVQAFVFSVLTLVFISMASEIEGKEA